MFIYCTGLKKHLRIQQQRIGDPLSNEDRHSFQRVFQSRGLSTGFGFERDGCLE